MLRPAVRFLPITSLNRFILYTYAIVLYVNTFNFVIYRPYKYTYRRYNSIRSFHLAKSANLILLFIVSERVRRRSNQSTKYLYIVPPIILYRWQTSIVSLLPYLQFNSYYYTHSKVLVNCIQIHKGWVFGLLWTDDKCQLTLNYLYIELLLILC